MGKKKFIIVIILILTAAGLLFIGKSYLKSNPDNIAIYQDMLIMDVYTDKSSYKPHQEVYYVVKLKNDLEVDYSGKLRIYFKHLDKSIYHEDVKVNLNKGEYKELNLKWFPPNDNYSGYMLEVYAVMENKVIDHRNTAIDVSSDWSKFPRYGYIANFPEIDSNKAKDIIDNLSRFHLNGLQFYDWQYKHDQPLAGTVDNPDSTWLDIANRKTSGKTVKDFIDFAHNKNMMAANYNLMYGAYEDYETRGVKKEWGLYKDNNHNEGDSFSLPDSWAVKKVGLMNPGNKEWQNYIFQREKDVMDVYKFDVFHVDTLGSRGTVYDYNGNEVKLDETYTDFLNNAKQALNKRIVVNNVQEFGKNPVSKDADVDFLYTEIWPPDYASYEMIKKTIDNDLTCSNGKKASVIAAYMNYGRQSGEKFNEHSVKLMDAAIFAAGGDHMELGDTGMLSNEYFANDNVRMTPYLISSMRKYYDFIVAYENILRDNMKEVNTTIEIPGVNVSKNGSVKTIWAYSKENKKYQTVQLINLLSREDDNWRDEKGNCSPPETKKDFILKLYVDNTDIKSINLASPDLNGGTSRPLKYSKNKDSKGAFLEIKVPELQYWDTIFIERSV
ncbi:MAG: glycoside hydrolase family 66 protein [Clostridium sp.]|uniref:glycoside hydrolase family 66 protein n=1 Tax=Clostridium sp. TaxID=1506 RepID=UPI003D6D93B3